MNKEQYDFIELIKKCDYRNDSNSREGVLSVWIPFYRLQKFTTLVGADYFSEDPPEVVLLETSIWINVLDYAERFDIDEDVFYEFIGDCR